MANMSLKKNPMPEQDPQVRAGNFKEVALGYTADIAVDEAINTAVSTVRSKDAVNDTTVYSLDGRVMGNDTVGLPAGIDIQGGKKIVVR